MTDKEKNKEPVELVRIGLNAEIPEKYVDDDGMVLEFDGTSNWIAKNEKGEVVRRVCF